jgi:hypothetical protein
MTRVPVAAYPVGIALLIGVQQGQTSIRGTVIGHDDLEIAKVLPEDALEGLRQILSMVVGGYAYTYDGFGGHV